MTGSQYNIPIHIWLLESHPYNPPIVEVRPTPTMQIKASSKVDHNGRVYLPYIHEWKHVSLIASYVASKTIINFDR
jgi:ESCRT-I complex subunit TSG101